MLLFCDSKHSPLVLLDNIYGQEHRLEMLQKQLALSAKAKSRIWHKIVVRKIQNQADCLELLERPAEDVGLLRSAVKNVTEGDKHNTEAYAAREYFQSLFGKDFELWICDHSGLDQKKYRRSWLGTKLWSKSPFN
ncbi:hypothetical protein LOB11_07620 [Lactobacillus delbrueckii subsp. lactis]|nr:hypothetical protein [Lactobacillus delbrueckii subsp. lactis]